MKKLLISILSLVMSVTVALGITACTNGPSDEEIATKAIDTVNVLYADGATSTPDDYTVIGQASVEEKLYPISWSVSPDTAKQYAQVGTMDENTHLVTIDITRTTVDVEYTLTASVTVGSATKTAQFNRKIPKKSSEDAITATLDLSAKENRTKYDAENSEQVWQQNGVTLYNYGNVGDFAPIRLYKNTTVEISMENAKITHIDFHSAEPYSDDPYPERLKTSIENSDLPIKGEVTLSEDGLTISVDFETPLEVVKFKTTEGQCRLTSIDVEAIERDPNEHVHQWTYEHIANTWTHKATCTAEGCDVNTKTEACTPKLNVCECGYTYSAKEIVDALFALETGKSLPGTYSLTGLVTKITDPYSDQYSNVTFTMTVEGQTITAYRVKGAHAAEVKEGGYATVTGELLDYNGTKEFTMGGSVVEFNDERTAQQKVDAALQALKDTFTVTEAGETDLPASTESDVTFTWATTDQTYTIANNKINVTALPAEDATVTATVTATCGTEAVTNNTKTVTITIKAEGSQPEIFYGTLEKPLTVAEVIALAGTIDGNGYLGGSDEPIQVVVKGIVIATGTFTEYNNWQNAYIADTADASSSDKTKSAQVYRLAADGTFLKAEGDLVIGATITIEGWLQAYNGKAEVCHNKATNTDCKAVAYSKENVTPPTPSDADATLSFADTANRTEITAEKQVWKQNDITFTNLKAGSSTDINEKYYNPVRLYKNSTAKIEYTSAIKKIVFHSGPAETYNDSVTDYPGFLKTVLEGLSGATLTVSGDDFTVEFATPQTAVEFTASAGQIRLLSIEIYADGGTTTPKTDAEKVAEAKAALKLSKTELTAVSDEVELPATQGEATVTYQLQGTTDLVKIDGGKLIVLKLPETDTEITIKATLTVGTESDNMDLTVIVKAPEPEITGDLLYTLTTATEQGSNNSYVGNGDIEVGDVTWNLEGNGAINPWRLGGNSNNCVAVDRKLTSKSLFGGTVKSLAITFGAATITVNSVTLKVYSTDPTESGAQAIYTQTVTFKKSDTTNVAAPASGWKDCYYQLIFNLTATSTSNQYVQISKIEFYGVKPAHVHQYTYKHDEGAWTHTATCSVPDCDKPTITEKCAPKLNHCEDCDYTYTALEIVTQLYKLSSGQSMPGTYSLKGQVKTIDDVYSSQFSNVTFTITVEGKDVKCYREKSSYSSTVKVGDVVTVQGVLKCYGNYSEREFDANCKIVELGAPEATDEEKVTEVLGTLNLTPTEYGKGVTTATVTTTDAKYNATITWTVKDHTDLVEITNGTLTVKKLPQEVTTVKIEVTVTLNAATKSKEFSITVNPEAAHVHVWVYEHVADSWTHTKRCSDPDCPDEDHAETTEDCVPVLNVCPCGYTYSVQEIAKKAKTLTAGQTMPGTYAVYARISIARGSDFELYLHTALTYNSYISDYLVMQHWTVAAGIDSADVKVYAIIKCTGSIGYLSSTTSSYKYGFANCEITELMKAEQVLTDQNMPKDMIVRQPGTQKLLDSSYNGSAQLTVNYTYEFIGQAPEGVTIEKDNFSHPYLNITKVPAQGEPKVDCKIKITGTCKTYTVEKTMTVTLQYGNAEFSGGADLWQIDNYTQRFDLHVKTTDYTEEELKASKITLISVKNETSVEWPVDNTVGTFTPGQDNLLTFRAGYMSTSTPKDTFKMYFTIGKDKYPIYLGPQNAIDPDSAVLFFSNISAFLTLAKDEAGYYLVLDRTNVTPTAESSVNDRVFYARTKLKPSFLSFTAVGNEVDLAAAVTALNLGELNVTWALTAPADASTYLTLAENKLKIVKLPDEVIEFTLTATLPLEEGVSVTKTFTFSLIPAADITFDMSTNTARSSAAQEAAAVKTLLDTACGNNAAFTGVTTATQVFKSNISGGPFQGPGCLKLGASSKNAELVLTFGKKVAKVIITWASWGESEGKLTVNEVGSDTFYSAFTTETFTLTTASDTLTLKSTGRVVITSISVYFEAEGAGSSVTFTEQQQGTFKCSGGMGDEGPDPDFDTSGIPDLVVSEHSITWGDKVITNLQAMPGDPNSFTFQIGTDNYGLNFMGGWMLVKFDAEGAMVEGYMFGEAGGLM